VDRGVILFVVAALGCGDGQPQPNTTDMQLLDGRCGSNPYNGECDPACPSQDDVGGLCDKALEGKLCGWFEETLVCHDGRWEIDCQLSSLNYCRDMWMPPTIDLSVEDAVGDGGGDGSDGGG
jgi:hypothetical protein